MSNHCTFHKTPVVIRDSRWSHGCLASRFLKGRDVPYRDYESLYKMTQILQDENHPLRDMCLRDVEIFHQAHGCPEIYFFLDNISPADGVNVCSKFISELTFKPNVHLTLSHWTGGFAKYEYWEDLSVPICREEQIYVPPILSKHVLAVRCGDRKIRASCNDHFNLGGSYFSLYSTPGGLPSFVEGEFVEFLWQNLQSFSDDHHVDRVDCVVHDKCAMYELIAPGQELQRQHEHAATFYQDTISCIERLVYCDQHRFHRIERERFVPITV